MFSVRRRGPSGLGRQTDFGGGKYPRFEMKDKRLVVLTGTLGEPSETFIRRHVRDLCPGHTVCIARHRYHGPDGWSTDAPTLVLDELAPLVPLGGARMVTRSYGLIRPEGLLGRDHTKAVSEFVRRQGVTVALGEFLDATLPYIGILQEANIPLVAHSHGSDVSLRLRSALWRRAYGAYGRSERVVAVSDVASRRLADKTIIPSAKIVVIPCGSPIRAAGNIRPGSRNELHCLAVGRLVPKKDPLGSLAAFLGASKHVEQRMRLTIVGDGPLRGQLEKAVRLSGAAELVRILGSRPHTEVEALLSDCDIFLQHSRRDPATGDEEGLPVAVLEAMSHGLAIVSTRHGGIPEAIEDGATGFLVAEGDYESMASRIAELARDPELRAELGERARLRHAAAFSWERERERLGELVDPYLTRTPSSSSVFRGRP
jgi:colanic acid/amylovoran biosynthesis glycosyltransferase